MSELEDILTGQSANDPLADKSGVLLGHVLQNEIPGGSTRGFPELDTQISDQRDRITKLLTNYRPSIRDIVHAGAEAVRGKKTYGETLNAIRASELSAQSVLLKNLTEERKARASDKLLGIQEKQLLLKELEERRKSGDELADSTLKAIEKLVPENERAEVIAHMNSDPEKYKIAGAGDVSSKVAQAAVELKKAGKITLVGKTKGTERDKKIEEYKALYPELDDRTRMALVDGKIEVVVMPNGQKTLVNKITGEERTLGGKIVNPDIPKKLVDELRGESIEIERVLGQIPDVSASLDKAIGAVSIGKEYYSRGAGQLPTGEVNIPGVGPVGTGEKAADPELIAARGKLRTFRENVLDIFRRSGRTPLEEQRRILALIPDPDRLINDPTSARVDLQRLKEYFTSRTEFNNRTLYGNAKSPPSKTQPKTEKPDPLGLRK